MNHAIVISHLSLFSDSPVSHSCDPSGSCGTGREENGVLVVENVQLEEAGYYMCTSTIQNSTTSGVCRVEVGGMMTD